MFVDPEEALWQEIAALAESEGKRLYDLEKHLSGLRVSLGNGTQGNGGTQGLGENQVSGDIPTHTDACVRRPVASDGSGVTSEDCAKLCRRLMVFLSVEGVRLGLGADPELEVSSPGLSRRLRLVEHYSGAHGELVKVRLIGEGSSVGKKNASIFRGHLVGVRDGKVILTDEKTGADLEFDLALVEKAEVIFARLQSRPGKSKQGKSKTGSSLKGH